MKKYLPTNRKSYGYALITFLCISSFNAHSQPKPEKHKDLSNLINVWLEYEKDYKNVPFMSGVIVDDQEIVWSGTFGHADVENKVVADENTMSSVCSISKVFTATAIMKLVDEGKLKLDDKVKDILPKYSVIQKYPQGGEVTIRSLLSHTSGLPRDTNHGYWAAPKHPFPTEDSFYESLSTQETTAPVGEEVSYSNIGYALLGQVIEEVTNSTYKQYMQNSIFQPLNMSNSIVEMQAPLYGNKHAIGYSAPTRYGKRERAKFYQVKAMAPAMGVSSTAMDLAKFAMWQFRLADSDKPELMSANTLKSMYESQSSKSDERVQGYGYLLDSTKDGREWAMHGGVCPGYTSFFRMDVTNKRAYAFLVSANRSDSMRNVSRFVRMLDRAEETALAETGQTNSTDLSDYTGHYDVRPWNSDYYVGKWGNGLVSIHFPFESIQYSLRHYKHIKDDTFQVVEDGELINEKAIFHRDKNGEILKLQNLESYHYRSNFPVINK